MTASASPPVFRIVGSRAPYPGNNRSKILWFCTGPGHGSWLITMPNGETLGPFENCRDAKARL
jgi:hypothetical protein